MRAAVCGGEEDLALCEFGIFNLFVVFAQF